MAAQVQLEPTTNNVHYTKWVYREKPDIQTGNFFTDDQIKDMPAKYVEESGEEIEYNDYYPGLKLSKTKPDMKETFIKFDKDGNAELSEEEMEMAHADKILKQLEDNYNETVTTGKRAGGAIGGTAGVLGGGAIAIAAAFGPLGLVAIPVVAVCVGTGILIGKACGDSSARTNYIEQEKTALKELGEFANTPYVQNNLSQLKQNLKIEDAEESKEQ